MKLYALHDKKAGALSSFHVERSDAQASRGFADAVNQPNSVFSKYPDDFELVAVADVFDQVSGDQTLDGYAQPYGQLVVILTASQVVALQERVSQNGQLSLMEGAVNG